jgi:hypothetical protein
MRLLFASIHSYLDPSSGAALATREMLELLAGRGMDCRVLSAGVLDHERETSLDEVLAALELPTRRFQAELGRGGSTEVIDLSVNGVRATLMPTASSRAERSPDAREAVVFLELAEQVFDRFRPDVLLTYGGHPAGLELMRRARLRGIAVVFHLHNFGYNCSARVSRPRRPGDRRSQGRAGARSGDLSVDNAAGSGDPRRTSWGESGASKTEFINPQPSKGMAFFARIAVVLNEANTPDPRDFYRVSRAVLVPSLWRESLGRVPMEALANGIPVLASDRGALPETLGDAGFVFTVPERCGPNSLEIPTAREVAPWLAVLEKLWDDPAFEARHRALARAEAQRWEPRAVAGRFEKFFRSLLAGSTNTWL